MSYHYSTFFRRVKRHVFGETEVTLYKPIIKETVQKKVIRIYQDKAYIPSKQEFREEDHRYTHERESWLILLVYRLLFSTSKCLDPLSNWLMVWYMMVFSAIIYFFVEVGIILTFG